MGDFLDSIGDRLPVLLKKEHSTLIERLNAAKVKKGE
jgi:hypothetical protein